ncbi:hypothetical protein JRO89_XS13G0011100 [Xanthoceras sorbifolium]|uniref:HTH TFE/IIEalpha-type domain-containing protein n=1 Tax=Xanthoceras sorbifolium TaxID=99658 RepID=A0ABQ8H5W4_9ROSI|nr:hypothetical protein JRO89_XS13G0011100 [Xanthoceras sorbifolium]
MSVEPFNRLVKLAARAFYDDITTKGDNNQPKTGRSDNRGIAVVVLDALTRRQWVREEDLAKDLKLHSKQLRRTLRFFEEEKLVTRDHRKEVLAPWTSVLLLAYSFAYAVLAVISFQFSVCQLVLDNCFSLSTAKGAKIYSAAVAATADGHQFGKEGDEKIKLHTHSYCCLDYAQVYDVVRYRMHRMKKKLKDELESKNTVQEYICPNCGRRYNALDALRLVSLEDEFFHCENCNGELVAESDKLAAQEGGDGDDNARRRRREKLKDMLQKMEVQLKPLVEQLNRVKDLAVPEFGSLQAWEARASAAGRAVNGDSTSSDPSKSSQGLGYGGTPMPFLGDTKVEVAFSGAEGNEVDVKSESGIPVKVLPPWMIKQGMNLTNEQRGELKEETKMDGNSATRGFSDDKKSTVEDDKDSLQAPYYAALLKKQQELEEAAKKQQEFSNAPVSDALSDMPSNRQVGMKSKRDEDDGDDDVDWEEAPVAGNASENYKVNDLNVEAEASGEDEDDIDWEEG